MSVVCKIEVYSHFFKVTDIRDEIKYLIREFCHNLIQYDLKKVKQRMVKEPARVFAAAPFDRTEYRFNRNQLEELLGRFDFAGYPQERFNITYRDLYTPVSAKIAMPKTWSPREHQVPVIDYAVSSGPIKVFTMQTGTGKTATSLRVAEVIGERLAIVVLGRYFEKWVEDVVSNYGLKPGRLLAVRGYKQLKTVMLLVASGEYVADVIIITSTTMRDYISDWENTLFKGYPDWHFPPEQLFEKLGIGVRIIDEAHQHFHLNFKMDLYTHVPKAIYLSATLEPDDPFIKRMYSIAYPRNTRMSGAAYHKFVNVIAMEYRLSYGEKAKCTGYGGQYSHVEYEKWLMKKKPLLQRYLEMIWIIVKEDYLRIRKPGQKMLIFAATIAMCQLIQEYISNKVSDIVVSKYTAEDDYAILTGSDISISTLGSAGTAVDIIGLITCLMTTSLRDSQANLQALGRTRELHQYPGQHPYFIYLYCADIPKQLEYHRKKVELFSERVLSHQVVTVAKPI